MIITWHISTTSHDHHMIITWHIPLHVTWLSHDTSHYVTWSHDTSHYMSHDHHMTHPTCHMIITWYIPLHVTWSHDTSHYMSHDHDTSHYISHDHHMTSHYMSHDHHMTHPTTCHMIITWSSCDITILTLSMKVLAVCGTLTALHNSTRVSYSPWNTRPKVLFWLTRIHSYGLWYHFCHLQPIKSQLDPILGFLSNHNSGNCRTLVARLL